jgi:uncharacterized protein (DUF1697 family)
VSGRPTSAAGVRVALLRGVNVGGANKLSMADLRAAFEKAGCVDVETVIPSGNVVFAASHATARDAPRVVAELIRGRFGVTTAIVVRSAAAMREIAESNPFIRAGADPAELHVMCLSSRPNAADVAALDPRRSPPDEFILRGSEIYLRLPNGVARSRLTNAYFDKALRTIGTARNWRTIVRLCAAALR